MYSAVSTVSIVSSEYSASAIEFLWHLLLAPCHIIITYNKVSYYKFLDITDSFLSNNINYFDITSTFYFWNLKYHDISCNIIGAAMA